MRHFVNFNTLKSIYNDTLESPLSYLSTVRAQNAHLIKRLLVLQKKYLRIMYFIKRNAHTSNLFKNLNILKLPYKVSLENCILICKYFNRYLLKTFKSQFTPAAASHTHNTRWSNSGCLKVPSHNTKLYGRQTVNISAVYSYNYLQKVHVNNLFYYLLLTKLKSLIKNSIFLIINNSLMSCNMHQCFFAFFNTKSFYYFNLIWFCNLFVQGSSLALLYGNCPLNFKLWSYFTFFQKMASKVFRKKGCSWRFLKGHLCNSLVLTKLQIRELAVLFKGEFSAEIFPV